MPPAKSKQQKTAPSLRPRSVSYRGIFITLAVLGIIGAALIGFVFGFSAYYQGVIYPNTALGPLDVSRQSFADAEQALRTASQAWLDAGLQVTYGKQTFVIDTVISDPANPELSQQIVRYDIAATMQQLRAALAAMSEAEHVYYWQTGYTAYPVVEIDESALITALREELSQYEQPAIDAQLVIDEDDTFSIIPEKGGLAFDYNDIAARVYTNARRLSAEPATAALEPDTPDITETKGELVLPLAEQVLDSSPYTVVYDEYAWLISEEQVRDWLSFVYRDGEIAVGLSAESMRSYMEEMAGIIDISVQEAKFAMEGDRVIEFQPSQIGRALQIEESIREINKKIAQVGTGDIDLMVEEIVPNTTTEEVNSYGIREQIGEGRSNFAGSPRNRRHNIAVGADTLNGIIIEPDEEFSLVQTLGAIEASTGYLPELVIKGNKTVPEYGGGLCQIGTTAFRAALDTGFPITERRNHSYRVSYYEPAGTDATIYDPSPDFRFVNDTGHHVLLTTEIDGNELIFRFFGTDDGRKVEQTDPYIYNIVRPGTTKLIETTDLAPGEKNCLESAHAGADAEFTRTITYTDGEQTSETFTSHYKPWRAVCLVGVEELSVDSEAAE